MPKVYIGAADNPQSMIDHASDWTYVRDHADGFYVNHIMLNRKISLSQLVNYCDLLKNKNAYLETDFEEATFDNDKEYIDTLKTARFKVTYSSLNQGYGATRRDLLRSHNLSGGQSLRPCLVQGPPWDVGGNIELSDTSPAVEMRGNFPNSDGFSTDGPMGYWHVSHGNMQSGSFSVVKYAKSRGKLAVVMISPYDAQIAGYDDSLWLSTAQSCVRAHEENGATPDVWAVFEYASSIAKTPEKNADGSPANTVTGFAYWLIRHIRGELA